MKNKNYWVKKKIAVGVGYQLGILSHKYEYPTSYLIATTKSIDKDIVCKLARQLNLGVHMQKGEWTEKGRLINDIIKTKDYGQAKEN